jgi:anti-sigma regulatory factor (Ser/Thr protein kinase)
MEVSAAPFHADFPMGDASRVGEARRHAAGLAHDCGLGDVEAGRLAIIVTELGNNLHKHARQGRLLIKADRGTVEVIAIDKGPGISNLARSLDDGFSTAGTPGTGLGAVRRLAQDFDIHSTVPEGTVVLARVRAAATPAQRPEDLLSASAVLLAAPGEQVCGDSWAFACEGELAALMVVDGLGHGPEAAEASRQAVIAFNEEPLVAPRLMLERVHARLRGTRGAAVMTLLADAQAGTLRIAGAGNVLGRLISGVSDRTLLGQHGTAGVTIRTPEETTTAWPLHALVVLCSDGIETRWKGDTVVPTLARDPAIAAALLARDHCRGRDDATVAVLRRRN